MDVTGLAFFMSRVAISRLNTNVNFQVCRSTIEMYLTNLCRSYLKSQSNYNKSQLPDQFQYLVMYVLGLLKQPFMTPYESKTNKPMVTLEALDPMTFLRFTLNHLSPEETLPLFNPWIMNIHDFNLSDQELPGLEPLDRSVLQKAQLLLCFNGLQVMIYVGKACDPWYINEIFKVQDFPHIDKHTSEEEIFAPGVYESSAYLVSLYNIINNSLRAQRQPFCELRIMLEGDPEADSTLRSLLVNDVLSNPVY